VFYIDIKRITLSYENLQHSCWSLRRKFSLYRTISWFDQELFETICLGSIDRHGNLFIGSSHFLFRFR